MAYNIGAIWFISAVWLVLRWLIALATNSGMVAVMVLPVVNAGIFVVAVAVVSVSSLSVNTLYILWEVGTYPCCPAVLRSCCTRMHLVYAAAMNVLRAGSVLGVTASLLLNSFNRKMLACIKHC